jgi:hypothetical protein
MPRIARSAHPAAGPRSRGPWRLLLYLWAGPTTLLGLLVALFSWLSGGRVVRVAGVLEVWGGASRAVLAFMGSTAVTLGHVVLGLDPRTLDRTRVHERAHVRQVERWGPLFIPAYYAAGVWAFLNSRHHYYDNWFELDAQRQEHAGEPGEPPTRVRYLG